MLEFVTEMCSCVQTFVTKLWDICLLHCAIWDGSFRNYSVADIQVPNIQTSFRYSKISIGCRNNNFNGGRQATYAIVLHDDVIKWKYFPRYWPFVRGIHRSPVNSPHKGQWRGALMFTLICARINGWVNNGEAGDLRRYRVHYEVTVMSKDLSSEMSSLFWTRQKRDDVMTQIDFPALWGV